jgi:cellulose synthase/poly-beta-1,6-N-acetylglucosamine synthase-like glycosyltransferase
VVLAAHNEEAHIENRLAELTEAIQIVGVAGEIIVVSDGSTDGTAILARAHTKNGVRVIELAKNVGKAAALTKGCAAAVHEIIVFADARQSWEPGAVKQMLENFADPSVGAVSGDLVVESSPGVMAGVGVYWRFEKWLRKHESKLHSVVGVTGAISAVRRSLFRPIPKDTILDDVYWPLQVAMQGFRVIHDSRAVAFDRLPESAGDEFRRKVRTLSGNFQLLTRLPAAILPWRNPIWFQFVSHKLLRLTAPWALLTTLIITGMLPDPVYRAAFSAQLLFYGLGLVGILSGSSLRLWVAREAAAFLILNSAAWLAFWVWATGNSNKSWRKVTYQVTPLRYSGT